MQKKSLKPIPLMTINSATFVAGVFQDLSGGGLPFTCDAIRIRNNSDVNITISWDAATIHDVLLSHSSVEWFFINTDSTGMYTPQIPKGTIIYIASERGLAGNGWIYLSGMYQEIE